MGLAVKQDHHFTEIMDRIERAARNGTRVHLELTHAQALIDSPVYTTLAAQRQKELIAQCRKFSPPAAGDAADAEPQPANPPGLKLVDIGSGIAPSETTGRSAGLMEMQRAAEQLVLEAASSPTPKTPRKKQGAH